MELDRVEQLEFQSVSGEIMDVLIVVSGYESRCTYLADRVLTDPLEKVVFAFREKRNEGSRPANDAHFHELKYDFYDATGSHGAEIIEALEKIFNQAKKDHLKIMIDYSCMTKEWYAAIINYFVNWDFNVNEIDLYFAYTPSTYEKPKRKKFYKRYPKPSPSERLDALNRPVSLVLGLGYSQDQARDLMHRLRPDRTYAFYSDPSIDDRFVKEVEKCNREILKDIKPDHVIRYPLNDMRSINMSLKQLCMDLRLSHQVILAPLGPKPFSLACMLLSARYPDIWVWKVHSGHNDHYYEWKPHGHPLVCKAVFRTIPDDQWA